MPKLQVSEWTKPEVDGECKKTHRRYDRALALDYTSYFEKHPDLHRDIWAECERRAVHHALTVRTDLFSIAAI